MPVALPGAAPRVLASLARSMKGFPRARRPRQPWHGACSPGVRQRSDAHRSGAWREGGAGL